MANTQRANTQRTQRANTQREFTTNNLPVMSINGEVYDIYVGKKYDFITVKCMVNDVNYQLFTVQADTGKYDIAVGDNINAECYITAYFDRNAKRVDYTYHVTDCDIDITG